MNTIKFAALLALSGCATAPQRDSRFIEIPAAINTSNEKIFSRQEVDFDKEQIIFALETPYSGSKFLPGLEFNQLLMNIKSIKGPLTAPEFCRQVDGYMDKVSDNHLSATFNNKSCSSQKAKATQPSVGPNIYQTKNNIPWMVQLESRGKAKALLISITKFSPSASPTWNGFLDKVKASLPTANFVVIDMRGNGGGDDRKGFELSTLLAGAPLKSPYAPQWNSFEPEVYQLFVNTFEYWARVGAESGKEPPLHIVQLRNDFIAKREQALKGERLSLGNDTETPGQDFVFERSIKKPIYILIDAGCASSCESTTDFFEFNPLAKTVGEHTAGYVHFGNNGNVFLKNTGVKLQIAVSYNRYLDGRFIEKKGIAPRISVPSGQDALNFAWEDFLKQAHL